MSTRIKSVEIIKWEKARSDEVILFIHLPTCLISFIHYNRHQNSSATVRWDCLRSRLCFHSLLRTSARLQPLTYGGTDVGRNHADGNCTKQINKNQTVLSLLWHYLAKRKLCSLPDDATINEIPVIDCFKPCWRLERGQCRHDRGRKEEFVLGAASKTGTLCETNVC